MAEGIVYSVFTKPWSKMSLDDLGEFVRDMGFDAVEYPLRIGYQVEPGEGAAGIVRLTKILKEHGVGVASLASGVDVAISDGIYQTDEFCEEIFHGCSEAGIGIIRICQSLDRSLGFHENIAEIKKKYLAILPLCQKYKVRLGIQPHCGWDIFNAAELYLLLMEFDPSCITAVWDSGHSGLAGAEPEIALDTLWSRLGMVNFKAAYYRRINGPEAEEALWETYWTEGRHAYGSWSRAVRCLKNRQYRGVVCLPAEYSDEKNVERYVRNDLHYIKNLFERQDSI